MIALPFIMKSARDGRVYEVGRLTITNDGTGTKLLGNYDFIIVGEDGNPYRRGRVERYPRSNVSRWRLIQRCLNQAFGLDSGGE